MEMPSFHRLHARLPAAVATGAFALAAARFAWAQAVLHGACAAGGQGRAAAAFLLVSFAATVSPGLFLWRALRLSTDNAALFLSHVLATSLGCAMLAPWLLLVCGLWTRPAALALALAFGSLGVFAVASSLATGAARLTTGRAIRGALRSLTLSEALALALALAVGELLFELTAGHPMQGWDAYLSWDKWAEDLAARRSLGGYVFGFYPPGIPLQGSFFYKLLPPVAGGPVPASAAHLLLHGFHAVFATLLLLSVCALARPLGFHPLVGQALVLSDFFLVQSLLKQAGDADVPLTAFCAAALAAALFAAEGRGGRRRAAPFAAIPALVALAFVKGTGIVMLGVAAFVLEMRRPRPGRLASAFSALAAGAALAAPFYLHQAALSRFPALAEHSPFHLTLPLEVAHTDLFTPDTAHLLGWLRKTAPNLCLGGGDAVSFTAAALAAGLVLAALARRRTRPLALSAILWFALWFFTGSYDWRNAFPAHLLAVLAAATSLERLADLPRSPALRRALSVLVAAATLALLARQRLLPLAADHLARRPQRPPVPALPEGERPARISALGDAFALFHAVPFLRDAPHLRMPGRDYRLVPNGVRGIPYAGADSFADPRQGDLVFARRGFFAATPDYLPVATLRGPRELGETLLLFRPVPERVPVSATPTPDGAWDVSFDGPAGPSSGFVEFRFPSDSFPEGVPEGFSVEWRRPGGASGPASLASAFDALVRPCADAHPAGGGAPVVRCGFWFPEAGPRTARLSAKAPLATIPSAAVVRYRLNPLAERNSQIRSRYE